MKISKCIQNWLLEGNRHYDIDTEEKAETMLERLYVWIIKNTLQDKKDVMVMAYKKDYFIKRLKLLKEDIDKIPYMKKQQEELEALCKKVENHPCYAANINGENCYIYV